MDSDLGLSPHIRGNGKMLTIIAMSKRSIPAHTGERSEMLRAPPAAGVYPRTYGGTRTRKRGQPNG